MPGASRPSQPTTPRAVALRHVVLALERQLAEVGAGRRVEVLERPIDAGEADIWIAPEEMAGGAVARLPPHWPKQAACGIVSIMGRQMR